MHRLVRPSGRIKAIGVKSSCYRLQFNDLKQGDEIEIVNQQNETLNIAKIIKIQGDEVIYRMIA